MNFYRVSYYIEGRVKFEHFEFLNEALEFVRNIRAAGSKANLQKVPRIEW